jgi:hypothetical protein
VNDNRNGKNGDLIGSSIITMETSPMALLNKPVTITWNNIHVKSPEKISCIERIKRRKNYQLIRAIFVKRFFQIVLVLKFIFQVFMKKEGRLNVTFVKRLF